jgi:beta-propeller repeat-containing protein
MIRATDLATILAVFAFPHAVTAGTPYPIDWSRQFGTNSTDQGLGVAADLSGNVLVTGLTLGNLNGQPNSGNEDAYLVKYDASGAPLWTRLIGTSQTDRGHNVKADAAGNIYVAGRTRGNLAGASGGQDGFVRKFSPDGTTLWTRQFGTTFDDSAEGLALDSGGNVYLTGYTGGNLDGQTNSGGEFDAFVRKLDSNGTLLWSRLLGSAGSDESNGVSVDPNGNVYFAGRTSGPLGGQPYNGGPSDSFLSKFDSSGTFQWARLLGASGSQIGYGVAADASGKIYLAGATNTALDGQTHSGSDDAFLAQYDSSGARLWTRLQGTSNIDAAYDMAIDDATGAIFTTGETRGSLAGPNQGLLDFILTKWDSSGLIDWTQQFGTSNAEHGSGVTTDPSGRVYTTGPTGGSLFGPNAGGTDAFVVRFSPEPFSAASFVIAWAAIVRRRRTYSQR